MAWAALDRNKSVVEADAAPMLTGPVREKIRSFFGRYETKRAALLPALHIVQNTLGHVPWQAMVEVAELLEIHPSDVIDTLSFYTHFWTNPKGKKVIMVCRSISCEVMGGVAVIEEVKKRLGIDEHGTTADGKYSLLTEECLAGCDHAPCMLVGEKLYKCVKPEEVAGILADPDNDRIDVERSDLFDPPEGASAPAVVSQSDTAEEASADGEAQADREGSNEM